MFLFWPIRLLSIYECMQITAKTMFASRGYAAAAGVLTATTSFDCAGWN
jgi:hypothetical protein